MTLYTQSKSFRRMRSNQGTIILSILIIISLGCLGFFYIIQTNGLVGQGYQIRDQKEHLKELQTENQKLQIEMACLQFPANLEEIAQNMGMTEASDVIYLEEESTVAVKK